jgi:hypothetical protein
MQLHANLLRTASFPFDWLVSPNVNAVHDLIASGFADFLRYENLKDITLPNAGAGEILDEANDIRFFHDFCPQTLDIQYDLIREKYKRRIRKFFYCIDGRNQCLFVRKQTENELLEDTIALGRFLRKKHGALHELLIISAEQSDKFDVRKIEEGIYLARMSHVNDAIINIDDWNGNSIHWNKLLSNVACRPMARIKEWFLSEVEKLLRLSVSKNRPLVFWGMGEMSGRLLPYFVNGGAVPVFYDRVAGLKLNEAYRRIEKEEFFQNPNDYFVIVTSDIYRNEMVTELEEHGHKRDDSYGMIPPSLALWGRV